MRLEDRPTVQVEIDIDAPRRVVWDLVTDPRLMGSFSPENLGGGWDEPFTGPDVGARFTSRNRWGQMEWETTALVVQCAAERVFSFVVGDVEVPAATWRYQFHPRKGGGTRLVEMVELGTGRSGTSDRITEVPDKEEHVIAARTAEHLRNMEATLAAVKQAAEAVVR